MREEGKVEEPPKKKIRTLKQPAKPTSAFANTRKQQAEEPEQLQETGKFGEGTGQFEGETAKFGGAVI